MFCEIVLNRLLLLFSQRYAGNFEWHGYTNKHFIADMKVKVSNLALYYLVMLVLLWPLHNNYHR